MTEEHKDRLLPICDGAADAIFDEIKNNVSALFEDEKGLAVIRLEDNNETLVVVCYVGVDLAHLDNLLTKVANYMGCMRLVCHSKRPALGRLLGKQYSAVGHYTIFEKRLDNG